MLTARSLAALLGCCALSATLFACSNSNDNADGSSGAVGGPVAGDLDKHCQGASGLMVQRTDPNTCHTSPSVDMGDPSDGGGSMQEDEPDYGETLYNSRGYDDDCKYIVNFYSTPVRANQPVTFYVTAINAFTNSASLGAGIRAEVFLSDTHPAPNSQTMTTEQAGVGSYSVGPILFDAAGRWTVRFHLFEECLDALPESPHGHAAFYVDVP
jgi:hypothetical protein